MLENPEQLAAHRLGNYNLGDQLKQHVYSRSMRAMAAGDQARDLLQTLDDVRERVQQARAAFLRGIGGLPPAGHPLHPQVTGTARLEGMRLEHIVFESRPAVHVTATLYIPDGAVSPAAAVLFVCGHFEEGRLAPEYQKVCQTIARAGLIVLAVDPPGQGERGNFCDAATGELLVARGTSDHEQAGELCWPLGDGLARYFLHDIVRAVDYLCSRPEVDPGRIGITGNSGGGLQTTMAMLMEPRIAAAAPGTFVMSRESYLHAGQAQDAEQIWPGMTALGFDHEDLLLAMAPKPVLVLAAEYDFFPIEGTRRTVSRVRRFWELAGRGDDLQLFEDRCPHHYSPAMAQRAASFFADRLKASPALETDEPSGLPQAPENGSPLEPQQLYATRSGQVARDFSGERGIGDFNIERLDELEKLRQQLPDPLRREQAVNWLREKVYASRKPVPWNPRCWQVGDIDGLHTESWLWWSQEGIFNHGYLFKAPRQIGGPEADRSPSSIMIAIWAQGTGQLAHHWEWIKELTAAGKAVLVLDISGEGAAAPNAINTHSLYGRFGTIHKLATDLFWLDDSLAALRVFDVCRAVEFVREGGHIPRARVEVYSTGKFALYAMLAAILDEHNRAADYQFGQDHVRAVADWIRSPQYEERRILALLLPGMLKYFDLPDLQRWTAGKK